MKPLVILGAWLFFVVAVDTTSFCLTRLCSKGGMVKLVEIHSEACSSDAYEIFQAHSLIQLE